MVRNLPYTLLVESALEGNILFWSQIHLLYIESEEYNKDYVDLVQFIFE